MSSNQGQNFKLEIDLDAHAAYIRMRDEAVASTEEVAEDVLVDLDEFRVVVGVEVLTLTAKIPFADLDRKYHVHSEDIELLRQVQPSIAGFLSVTFGSDSSIHVGSDKNVRADSGKLQSV
ncbi:DUF2283 domain-containing protein [Kocuria marina]|uniref:DUF2283 domain-containing protein n=1 Tax=Kocuria marina TaxID=223184 RepID=UPI00345F62E1